MQPRKQHQLAPPVNLRGSNNGNNYHHHENGVPSRFPGYRKTTAEIVNEARTLLAVGGGGARLVSTRRPITPREPRRQLYGKLAPPGRPPSAFSLRYLQFESRSIPPLEPIPQNLSVNQTVEEVTIRGEHEVALVPRSGSVGTLLDYVKGGTPSATSAGVKATRTSSLTGNSQIPLINGIGNVLARPPNKLPALLSPPIIASSLDNLSEAMPPHPDLPHSSSSQEYKISRGSNSNGTNVKIDEHDSNRRESSLKKDFADPKQHPLRKRQTKSFEMPLNPSSSMSFHSAPKDSMNLNDFKEETIFTKNPKVPEEEEDEQKEEFVDASSKNNTKTNNNNERNIIIPRRVTKENEKENNIKMDAAISSLESGKASGMFIKESEPTGNVDWDGMRNINDNTKRTITTGMGSLSKTRLTRSNDLLAQSSTETLLELLKAHTGIKECNEETVQHINAILTELYTRVKGAKGNWRSTILGALYGLVECSSPKILLSVARVILALCVTGSNLTGACKLVFKVARNEVNDYLFADTDVPELLIDGLGRASPIDEPEACIYGYGAVRFLANASQMYQQGNSLSENSSNSNNNNNSNLIGSFNELSTNSNENNNNAVKVNVNNSLMNKQKLLAQRLAKHGAVQLMVLHLQILNEAGLTQKLCGQPLHALYQLAAALRALAGLPQIFTSNYLCNSRPATSGDDGGNGTDRGSNFNAESHEFPVIKESKEPIQINLELACPHLVKAAEISIVETEIQSNIVRTLSVLSEQDACCEALSEYAARIGMLLGPCNIITKGLPEKPLALLSRLGYILGNIMARFDSARIQFYNNDVAMQYLLEALDTYSKQKFTIHNQMGDTVVDVLIKLVRVVANMSVNADVGYGLGVTAPLGQILLHLLVNANKAKGYQMTSDLEELLQATLGALHNLSFYQDNSDEDDDNGGPIILNDDNENNKNRMHFNLTSNNSNHNRDNYNPPGSVRERMAAISVALCETLKNGPDYARSEASRVLGNITRNPIAREAFCKAGGLKAIITCLNQNSLNDYELLASSAGVLVNLLGDWERRAPFRELKGPQILREILYKSSEQEDWLLAGIVCQALWNYLIDSGNVIGALGEKEADYIAENLANFIDEDKIFKGEPPDILWEQFATVATDLLERIQASLSMGNSPYASSEDEDNTDFKFSQIHQHHQYHREI